MNVINKYLLLVLLVIFVTPAFAQLDTVILRQEYDIHTGEPLYQWYYSEDVGLISVKYGDRLLTLVN